MKQSPAQVLIVEDEFLLALQLEDMLQREGYEVVGVIGERSALGQVAQTPQVALVDINLRDGATGPEIAKELAERGTVIFYVTANPEQIGKPAPTARGIVQKPFSYAAISTALIIATGGRPTSHLPPELNLFPDH